MNKTLIAAIAGVAALALVGIGVVVTRTGPSTDADPSVDAGTPPDLAEVDDQRPNVLIILWDTVRADRLSLYGYDLDHHPAAGGLGQRQRRGVRARGVPGDVDRAVPRLDVHRAGPHHPRRRPGPSPPSTTSTTPLAEHFKANGYQTYAFSANPNLSPKRVNPAAGLRSHRPVVGQAVEAQGW